MAIPSTATSSAATSARRTTRDCGCRNTTGCTNRRTRCPTLRLPEYDRLYEQAHALPDGPARNAIYRKLNDIIANYAPWILADYPYRNDLTQPWLRGFKANAFQRWQWAYYDASAH